MRGESVLREAARRRHEGTWFGNLCFIDTGEGFIDAVYGLNFIIGLDDYHSLDPQEQILALLFAADYLERQ